MKITTLSLSVLAALFAIATSAQAANINWGDISGDTVVFEDVTEDNDEASTLFAPEATGPSAVGDMLVFDPQSFQSQSNNGADLIDSTLSTTIAAVGDASIDEILINEFGDYSLGGLTGGEAEASVGAAFFWRILEIDGEAAALPIEGTNLIVSTGGGPNGGEYERPGDDGTAVIWTGSAVIDIAAYLTANDIDGSATLVSLRFDNTLQTAADQFSNAFIKKKGVDITVTTDRPEIPEPATAAIALLGVGLLATRRRRG